MPLDTPEYAHLRDMLDYARRVTRLTAGVSFAQDVADETRQMAVERGIEIVGEAANRISATDLGSRDYPHSHPRPTIARDHT